MTIACSRAPEPRTRIFTPTGYPARGSVGHRGNQAHGSIADAGRAIAVDGALAGRCGRAGRDGSPPLSGSCSRCSRATPRATPSRCGCRRSARCRRSRVPATPAGTPPNVIETGCRDLDRARDRRARLDGCGGRRPASRPPARAPTSARCSRALGLTRRPLHFPAWGKCATTNTWSIDTTRPQAPGRIKVRVSVLGGGDRDDRRRFGGRGVRVPRGAARRPDDPRRRAHRETRRRLLAAFLRVRRAIAARDPIGSVLVARYTDEYLRLARGGTDLMVRYEDLGAMIVGRRFVQIWSLFSTPPSILPIALCPPVSSSSASGRESGTRFNSSRPSAVPAAGRGGRVVRLGGGAAEGAPVRARHGRQLRLARLVRGRGGRHHPRRPSGR